MLHVVKIICFLPALFVLPTFLQFLVIAPEAAFDSIGSWTTMQLLAFAVYVVGACVGLVWTIYFGWRTIRTWRSPSCVSALLMTLPAVFVIALVILAMAGAG
jgi:hypothetical protein